MSCGSTFTCSLLSAAIVLVAGGQPELDSAATARSPHLALSCCPPIVKAAQELLEGYYTEKAMEWVPYSKALRSVNIAAPPKEKFDILMFGDSLDRFVLDEICSSSFLPNASIHGYPAGRGTTTKHNTHTCTSPWGRITWVFLAGTQPAQPYRYYHSDATYNTPDRITATMTWYAQHFGHPPHVVMYQQIVWDAWGFTPSDIKLVNNFSSYEAFMSSFNYKNAHKSHVTRWMRSYIKNTERYIEIIRRLAGSETLVMMRTGPLSHGMLMSSMMTAIRKIGVRQCVPVLDWDFLSHVHVLGPHKHALASYFKDELHPKNVYSRQFGVIFMRFVRYFYEHHRKNSNGVVDWNRCDAPPFNDWTYE